MRTQEKENTNPTDQLTSRSEADQPWMRTQEKENTNPTDQLTPNLKEAEHEQVERRTAPRAAVVYEAIRAEGEEELRRPTSALAWSGVAAGLSMGFSMVAMGLLRAHLPDAPWRPLVASLGYSIGFLIVILGRQQLFTENTLTPILPLRARRSMSTLLHVLRLWATVFAANMVGALLFAWVVSSTSIFDAATRQVFSDLGLEALKGDFGNVVLRGIFAGWLIAMMVWLLPVAEVARVNVIIIITSLVALGGFTHIIAGAIEMFFLALSGAASWGAVIGGYILPTLIGNIIGGVALVAALNFAQVISGQETNIEL
jgi:formate/nitrite transporter FocA (FNT family)